MCVFVVFGIWYWFMRMNPSSRSASQTNQNIASQNIKDQVIINQNSFDPDPISIRAGETVTWINNESYGHDVTSDDGIFVSPKMATGDKYSFKFSKVGTFNYHCSIHPFMHGTILVTK